MHGPFAQLGCQRQLEECGGVGTLSRNGDPRTTQDVMAAGRRWAGTEVARWRARRRRSCTDSLPNLPPVSMPTMTYRQRRVRVKLGVRLEPFAGGGVVWGKGGGGRCGQHQSTGQVARSVEPAGLWSRPDIVQLSSEEIEIQALVRIQVAGAWERRRRDATPTGAGLSVEPAASLGAEDDKAASSGAAEFGVSAVTLAPGSSIDCAAWQGVCAGVGLASWCEGGHDCCVKGELGPVPQGETIGDDLDAMFISDGHVEVHVCQPDIAGDIGRPWRRLRGKRARRHAREAPRASTTQHVELPMARASARRKWQRHAQAPQQEDAEQGARDPPHYSWAGQ
eukprot:s2122_g37.t1